MRGVREAGGAFAPRYLASARPSASSRTSAIEPEPPGSTNENSDSRRRNCGSKEKLRCLIAELDLMRAGRYLNALQSVVDDVDPGRFAIDKGAPARIEDLAEDDHP